MQFLNLMFFGFAVFLAVLNISNALRMCIPCLTSEECEQEPTEYCMWGETRNYCNRRICAKGPGERCGSRFHMLEDCGEGLMCKYGRCFGCSVMTFQCFP